MWKLLAGNKLTQVEGAIIREAAVINEFASWNDSIAVPNHVDLYAEKDSE